MTTYWPHLNQIVGSEMDEILSFLTKKKKKTKLNKNESKTKQTNKSEILKPFLTKC